MNEQALFMQGGIGIANRRPVSSVGRVSDNNAGGLGFKSQTGPALRVLK